MVCTSQPVSNMEATPKIWSSLPPHKVGILSARGSCIMSQTEDFHSSGIEYIVKPT
jgi:hypothetical protein